MFLQKSHYFLSIDTGFDIFVAAGLGGGGVTFSPLNLQVPGSSPAWVVSPPSRAWVFANVYLFHSVRWVVRNDLSRRSNVLEIHLYIHCSFIIKQLARFL
jgi:hypothetical protein